MSRAGIGNVHRFELQRPELPEGAEESDYLCQLVVVDLASPLAAEGSGVLSLSGKIR